MNPFNFLKNLAPTITFQKQPAKVESIDFNLGYAEVTLMFENGQRYAVIVPCGEFKALS